MTTLTAQDYRVGWICALHNELTAAMAMLDEEHDMLAQQDAQDRNSYVLGRIHKHHVVIATLPEGVDGLVSAASVARDMVRTFPALRIGLMVGIGGGIPNLAQGLDIRLGDIVVSTPQKTWGGVVQYDKGKAEQGGHFVLKGQLNQPPALLLNTVTQLRARHKMRPSQLVTYIGAALTANATLEDNGFGLPEEFDCFHCGVCDREIDTSAMDCAGFHVQRKPRKNRNPVAHYGVIASGNQVVKDAIMRDRLRDQFGALCVEMEAAGLMNDFPCLVIRGICDYADVHKNDAWHPYAAMTAAAYAKELLLYITPAQTSHEQPMREVLGVLDNIHKTAEAQLEATHAHIRQTQTQYDSENHRQCHRTFKIGPYEEQKNINPMRVDGTCQWVLSHPQYRRWYTNEKDDLLWISADPGCGKSVLTRFLVDHELRSSTKHVVCYFFFKDNEEQDQLATALCALIHQLLSQQSHLIYHALPTWNKAGSQLIKDVSELWRILLLAAQDKDACDVICVLDGMDECRPADRFSLIEKLSHFYNQISSCSLESRKGRLRFLVTSRPYDDIQAEFQKKLNHLPTIRLRGENENDQIRQEIDLVIQMRVDKLADVLRLSSRIKQRLIEALLGMEHRTYLWLHLTIDDIAKTYRGSLRPEETMVQLLPKTVEAAYDKILARVSDNQKDNVKKILQLVVGARRPLTIQEMAIALGIATTARPLSQSLDQISLNPTWLGDHIRQLCGLFVFINHNRIYLIHQTAKDYLVASSATSLSLSGWKHSLDTHGTAKEMTRICTTFICLAEVRSLAEHLCSKFSRMNELKDVLNENDSSESFLAYSAEHWPYHLREAQLIESDTMLSCLYPLYDTRGHLYDVWFPIFWKALHASEHQQPSMTPLRLVALLGHETVLPGICSIHEDGVGINASLPSGKTALYWACFNGHTKVVQILLDKGANVNSQGDSYGNPLHAASWYGHERVVQILLDNGADVHAQYRNFGDALLVASAVGYEKVVRKLLEAGAEVNAQGGAYGNALQAASANGYEKVVQILLNKGADVNARGGHYGTALQAASAGGYERVVQMLLEAGADINTQGGGYGHALQAASRYGYEKIVQILLEAGANVNAHGNLYRNALQAASLNGHQKVVQMLLDKGATSSP